VVLLPSCVAVAPTRNASGSVGSASTSVPGVPDDALTVRTAYPDNGAATQTTITLMQASGATVTKTGSAQYDAATGTVALTSMFEEGPQGEAPARWVRHDRLRLVSADVLTGFAEAAGLRVETLAGDYDLDPLGPGSDRAVLVAVRP